MWFFLILFVFIIWILSNIMRDPEWPALLLVFAYYLIRAVLIAVGIAALLVFSCIAIANRC